MEGCLSLNQEVRGLFGLVFGTLLRMHLSFALVYWSLLFCLLSGKCYNVHQLRAVYLNKRQYILQWRMIVLDLRWCVQTSSVT